mmetsp:Transcript_8460/g.20362  ORF Transcript_8460/g.20362 Transcript_8460/m.20362 type:complete len:221 (-) Transcript_8460:2176-2838(-)
MMNSTVALTANISGIIKTSTQGSNGTVANVVISSSSGLTGWKLNACCSIGTIARTTSLACTVRSRVPIVAFTKGPRPPMKVIIVIREIRNRTGLRRGHINIEIGYFVRVRTTLFRGHLECSAAKPLGAGCGSATNTVLAHVVACVQDFPTGWSSEITGADTIFHTVRTRAICRAIGIRRIAPTIVESVVFFTISIIQALHRTVTVTILKLTLIAVEPKRT